MKLINIYILLLLTVSFFIVSCSKSTKKIDKNGVIYYYTSSVPEQEAEHLLDYVLKEGSYDENNKLTIRLDFEKDSYLFQIVMKNGTQLSNDQIEDFKLYSQQLSKEIFANKKVIVQILDEQFELITEISPIDV